MSDEPYAALNYSEIYFETYIVASEFNSGKTDKILAQFNWGFKNFGKQSIHGSDIPLKLTNSLSATAKNIIKNDGSDYKTVS